MMSKTLSDQLRAEAEQLTACAATERSQQIEVPLQQLFNAARGIGVSWSGSSLGYHARVYYKEFQPPPPGTNFSVEWGFFPATAGRTKGEWAEYRHEDVLRLIHDRAGNLDLTVARAASQEAKELFDKSRAECLSILSIFLDGTNDTYIGKLRTEIEELHPITEVQALSGQLPSGQVMTRDPNVNGVITAAPHQEVLARVVALRSNFQACTNLAKLVRQAASHIDRVTEARSTKGVRVGGNVFIGHGGSLVWRVLKDFIQDELGLPCDEFNRVEAAGTTTVGRLQQMLDQAAFAFLVLTAEDERTDGRVTARENVIHEVGLFPGRLGFERAIIMLEEGCNEFSNIHGLTQIRFDAGKIESQFERVRRVLRREGLIA